MQILRDQDADLDLLCNANIAILGYGNQGRAQALNLRESGLRVIVGNQSDAYAEQARQDGFNCLPIQEAVRKAHILLLLIPDEVIPQVFHEQIQPEMQASSTLVFASGYNVAFKQIELPASCDVILLAPRMIGAGVRDLYLQGRGFPSFIGVEQDVSGKARQTALALAKGIGSTVFGVVEVTFQQEAELDLFTEQCFGPAFGNVLTSAVDLLLEQGYPPEAVLLELYMSGELAYTFQKIAEMGIMAQSSLHSRTSQYGSLTRGMRFMIPEIRDRMQTGLDEIRSGEFAREWRAEQEKGAPSLDDLKEVTRSLPLHALELELLRATGRAVQELNTPGNPAVDGREISLTDPLLSEMPQEKSPDRKGNLIGWLKRLRGAADSNERQACLDDEQLYQVLRDFLASCESDESLLQFADGDPVCIHYQIQSPQIDFYMQFGTRSVKTGFGAPQMEAQVQLQMAADVLDGIFTRRTNAMSAAMSGKLRFQGDPRQALGVQKIQDDLCRLYLQARTTHLGA